MAEPPSTLSGSTTGETKIYTVPPEEPKPTDASKGEDVKPPVCCKCGAICYDGERLNDKKIYCRKCLKKIVEDLIKLIRGFEEDLHTQDKLSDEGKSYVKQVLLTLKPIIEAKND